MKQLYRKLDNQRIGLFKILKKRGLVNFKLQLPKGIRIHLVFYVFKLEPALDNAELTTNIKLKFNKYKVKEI
jgi:hypothetical protein